MILDSACEASTQTTNPLFRFPDSYFYSLMSKEYYMRTSAVRILVSVILSGSFRSTPALDKLDEQMPIRGFCIGAPAPNSVEPFVAFIQNELAPRHVNILILRVDYRYQYESNPKLRDNEGISKEAVKRLVNVCKTNHIRLIPQINLLG